MWLSFLDTLGPDAPLFLGVIITRVPASENPKTVIARAVNKARRLGDYPNGEIQAFQFTEEDCPIEPEHLDRLLSFEELEATEY